MPDALGSVRQVADAEGNVVLTQDYDPYGSVLNSSGKGNSPYGFTGEERDSTGLVFLRARYMQPKTGIFLSHDPANWDVMQPGSMNGFNYVGGNPILRSDPSGRCYPPLEFLRQIEPAQCANLDQGILILTNPNSTFGQRLLPSAYITIWSSAHIAVVAGSVVATYGGVVAWGSRYLETHPEVGQVVGECAGRVWDFLKDRVGALKDAIQGLRSNPSVWQLDPLERGVEIENALGRSPQLVQNFPVIDRFVNGVATSIKSIDLSAVTYQNLSNLASTVRGYVTTLANWQGATWGNFTITAAQITGRELLLAIPNGATPAQVQLLQQLQQWAATLGVTLNTTTVP